MASIKNNMRLFTAMDSVNKCSQKGSEDFADMQFPFMAAEFKAICFAYNGDLANSFKLQMSYFDYATGEDKIEETWAGAQGQLGDSEGEWKFVCLDLDIAFSYSALAEENQNMQYLVAGIELVDTGSGDVFVDNVQILRSVPEGFTAEDQDLISALNGRVSTNMPPTSDINVTQDANDTNVFEIEFTPVNCAYNYPLLDFYGIERSVSGDKATYTNTNWPQGSYIEVERTQHATPPLSGKVSLDYSSGNSQG